MQLFPRLLLPVCLAASSAITVCGADASAVQPIEHVRQLAFAHKPADVLVRGVVIEAPGRLPADPRFFQIQDHSGGIAVFPGRRLSLKLGDCVDVVGSPMLFNDLEPQMEARRVTAADQPCAAPEVRTLSVNEVRTGHGSGALVRVAGRVVDSSAGDDRALILIGDVAGPLRVVLRRPGGALAEIRRRTEANAWIEAVGVSLPSADGKSHYVRVRSISDIVQTAPPPFRPHPALVWFSFALLGIAVATGVWIVTLRRAVASKTGEISRLLEQAQAASRFKSQFLANMSHEIRTPIHGIMGMQELVLQSELQPVQRESLEIAHSATRSLLSLLNDILDLSKIEADCIELTPETLNLHGMIVELERQFRASARVSGVDFNVAIAPEAPKYVKADPVRLRQVLTNLLSNAFKFTSAGSVTLRCSAVVPPEAAARRGAARFHFEVQDTGIGIEPSEQEQIFSAFHQADGSITRRFGGTGLGLTIASRLVALMGGDLRCESAKGQGSRFCFDVDLPLAANPETPEPQGGDGAPASKLRVLLAEDNSINQIVVRRPLEALGHKVVTCQDGEQAVALCSKGEFDVVLMDVQMPVLDGLEAARRIRRAEADAGTPRVPILALTANSLREQVNACFAAGMDDCLCKPFLPADLMHLIAIHARRSLRTSAPGSPRA